MTKENQNFEVTQGDHKEISITITTAGIAKDLTGATVKWGAFQKGRRLIFKSSTDTGEIELTNTTGGIIQVNLVPGDTSGLTGKLDHEVEVTDATGKVSTVTRGILDIKVQRLK